MPASASPARNSKSRAAGSLACLALAGCVVAVDRLTKVLASRELALGDTVPVWPFFQFTLVHNRGAAFGLLPHHTGLLIVVAVIASVVIVRQLAFAGPRWSALSLWLTLILGGAIGNVIDRLVFGYVIDFIDLRVWPVFNVADASVTIGGVGVALWTLMGSQKSKLKSQK